MKWIQNYQLFLFDFDGLLVNTEHIHFQAYINMCAKRNIRLEWNFRKYIQFAHLESTGIRDAMYAEYPKLLDQEPKWDILRDEKQIEYLDLLKTGKIELMPGVETLLKALRKEEKKSCVVTNSTKQQVDLIKTAHPALKRILHWITRENYLEPKPHPESYLKAIQLYGEKGDRIIGFEDTIKGIRALVKTPAQAVLICPSHHPQLQTMIEKQVFHFSSLEEIPENFLTLDKKS